MENYIICGIHTNSGKSVASVLMYQLLKNKNKSIPQIIKPLQTGQATDTDFYERMNIDKKNITNFYTFQQPISPHLACRLEDKLIDYDSILKTSRHLIKNQKTSLIFEIAGGVYSPVDDQKYMIDLMEDLSLPAILVVNDYVGAINHTFLTIEALKKRKIDVKGIIYNRTEEKEIYSELVFQSIIKNTNIPELGEIENKQDIESWLSNEEKRNILIKDWKFK